MEFIINQIRKEFYENGTTGRWYIPNFGPPKTIYTCEDAVRPNGLKIPKFTALPDGVYLYELTFSPAFKRLLPLIYNEPVTRKLIAFGRSWEGVRMHVGNGPDNSLACVLTGYSMTKGMPHVYESAKCERDIVAHLEAHAPKGMIVISSQFPL